MKTRDAQFEHRGFNLSIELIIHLGAEDPKQRHEGQV